MYFRNTKVYFQSTKVYSRSTKVYSPSTNVYFQSTSILSNYTSILSKNKRLLWKYKSILWRKKPKSKVVESAFWFNWFTCTVWGLCWYHFHYNQWILGTNILRKQPITVSIIVEGGVIPWANSMIEHESTRMEQNIMEYARICKRKIRPSLGPRRF